MQQQIFAHQIKAHFNLRSPHSKKTTNIYFVIYCRGKQVKIPTQMKVYPDQWDFKKELPIISTAFDKLDNKNNALALRTLKAMKSNFLRCLEELKNNPVNLDNVHEITRNQLSPIVMAKQTLSAIAVIKKDIRKNQDIRDSSKNTYLKELKPFEEWLKSLNKGDEGFDIFTEKLILDYRKYLQTSYKNPRGKQNTVGRINYLINKIKQHLENYTDRLQLGEFEKIKKIKPIKETTQTQKNKISLRDDEVLKLWNFTKLSDEEIKVRDLFVFQCLTGQRISDVQKLDNIDNLNGILVMHFTQQKTGQQMDDIPFIFELAVEILKKYNYTLPLKDKKNLGGYINRYIKKIAKKAGINGTHQVSEQRGNNKTATAENKQRWELISTHTARRTFVSLLSVRGFSHDKIKQYTGHQSTDMIDLYNKAKPIDDRIYNNLKEEHPELVLKTILYNDKNQPNNTTDSNLLLEEYTKAIKEQAKKELKIEQLEEEKEQIRKRKEEEKEQLLKQKEVEQFFDNEEKQSYKKRNRKP